jgi:hypothetical protein
LHCARPGQVQCGLHLSSDRHGQLVERHGQPPARHLLSSQLVMAPSNVLDKGMAANAHPGGTVLLEAAHRPYLGPVDGPLKEPAGCLASRRVWRRESGAMDCLLPGAQRARLHLPPAEVEAGDLGVVVGEAWSANSALTCTGA